MSPPPPESAQSLPGRPGEPFVPFPRSATTASIGQRFASQVRAGPQRLALSSGKETLSYADLDRQANRIARMLLSRQVPAAQPVAILARQGPSLIAAILGALKAGEIYLPLDPAHPPELLRAVLADAGPAALLTDGRDPELAASLAQPSLPRLGPADWDHAGDSSDPRLPVPPGAGAALYYTSGSTGAPKGVLQTHQSILHNVLRYTQAMRISPADRCSLVQSSMFSGCMSSLFSTLLNGASLFLYDLSANGTASLADWTSRSEITVYHSVPALFRELLAGGGPFPALRLIRLEGDQATQHDAELFQRHLPSSCCLSNGLGATETGLVCRFLLRHGAPVPEGLLPVGWPVDDVELHILDPEGRPLPAGSVGEISVRSAYLAAGYWRRPAETAAAFQPDPTGDGRRVYRTGDLGRLRPDGALEHLGRADGRVRMAGQWVDLADLESALLRCADLRAAAAVLRQDHSGDPRLVAYLVPAPGADPGIAGLRRRLAEHLPAHAIPSAFVTLPSLPLTAHGKVDRSSLPPPSSERPPLEVPFAAPRTETEHALAALWRDLLGIDRVGIHDSFFDLGGASLSALRLLSRVRQTFRTEIPLQAFFATPTVAGLIGLIGSAPEEG